MKPDTNPATEIKGDQVNATELLSEVRHACRSLAGAAGPDARLAAAELLAARFGALDELLRQGGQPPADWPVGPSGADLTKGAGPDDFCGCGELITMFEDRWMHIYNPELRGTDDHESLPDGTPQNVTEAVARLGTQACADMKTFRDWLHGGTAQRETPPPGPSAGPVTPLREIRGWLLGNGFTARDYYWYSRAKVCVAFLSDAEILVMHYGGTESSSWQVPVSCQVPLSAIATAIQRALRWGGATDPAQHIFGLAGPDRDTPVSDPSCKESVRSDRRETGPDSA